MDKLSPGFFFIVKQDGNEKIKHIETENVSKLFTNAKS